MQLPDGVPSASVSAVPYYAPYMTAGYFSATSSSLAQDVQERRLHPGRRASKSWSAERPRRWPVACPWWGRTAVRWSWGAAAWSMPPARPASIRRSLAGRRMIPGFYPRDRLIPRPP